MTRLKALEAIAGGITGKSAPPIKIFDDLNLLNDDLFSDVPVDSLTLDQKESSCPICDEKRGNYGLRGEWYKNETEYCLTCNTSRNKFKFAIVSIEALSCIAS